MKLPTLGRVTIGLLLVAALAAPVPAFSQDKPRYGGELTFVVPSEPPSFDGHREETFGLIHPIAPHYNTLFRTDPTDNTGTKRGGRSRGVLAVLQGHAHADREDPART